jgi:DNA end-binding protein Ku
MPPRAIGSATVSFGLVSIPVKLYSATESGTAISFNMLHKDCGSRLKQQYVCQKDGQVVSREDTVKGYEFAKDQYVIFSNEELKALEEAANQSIDIAEFVPLAKVDPVYFDKAYFLGPEKGGDKAYRLLCKAMRESGQAALATYAARGKQYLVMIRPGEEDRLVMQQLHYADEVRSAKDIVVPEGEVRDQELKLAMQLIAQIQRDTFDPTGYKDVVKERMQKAIDQKVAGQEVSLSPVEAPKAQIIDLMEALKASLAKKEGGAVAAKPAVAAAPAAPMADEARKGPAKAEGAAPKRSSKKAAKE